MVEFPVVNALTAWLAVTCKSADVGVIARIVSIGFSLITLVILYALAQSWFGGRVATWTGLAWATIPYIFFYSRVALPEPSFVAMLTSAISFFWFFFSSRRRHTRWNCDWSSDVCSSDLNRTNASCSVASARPSGRSARSWCLQKAPVRRTSAMCTAARRRRCDMSTVAFPTAVLFTDTQIEMAHGAGGTASRRLVEGLIAPLVGARGPLGDAATLTVDAASIALTTDSFVVRPLRFPGGSIGDLAVNGTVNDLAVAGAIPLAMVCSLIIEAGTPIEVLQREAQALGEAARRAGVRVVGGDTKVVEHGKADGLYV